jgi:hypothetical protein
MKKISLAGLALCLLIAFSFTQPINAQEELLLIPPSEGGGGGAPLPANTTFGGLWTLAGPNADASTHPQAKLQPGAPTVSRWLWSLKVYNGALYAGYGDYGSNGTSTSGVPYAITPFDPVNGYFDPGTNSPKAPLIQLNAEAVPIYRIFFGKLFAPINDASDNIITRNYATDSIGNNWSEVDRVEADHIFDIAYTQRFHTVCECTPVDGCTMHGYAGDIWIVGARLNSAIIWHSENDGKTFSEFRAITPGANPYGLTHSRFYFAGVIQNKVYVQAYDFSAGNNPNQNKLRDISYVVDGDDATTWRKGPDLFPRRAFQFDNGYAPEVFNNYMVYLTRFSSDKTVRKLRALSPGVVMNTVVTGTVTDIDLPDDVVNFTIDGQYLYVLLENGAVGRTTDITLPWFQWETYPPFPEKDPSDPTEPIRSGGRSIAVLNGVLYIGSTEAQMWKLLPW